ncbi:hypothetical protein Vretimale_1234 [Volvox reticuliferus]|uniref:Uncharacterized protein n=1 Tax=Volvox reticuliferus TaxID=1737510 RepID=A0A8J4D428_9CHLO|nr:hypothetical protein Vretimale_1234 [Volvox reticuliferus]
MGSSVCLTLCNAGQCGITPVQDWQSCTFKSASSTHGSPRSTCCARQPRRPRSRGVELAVKQSASDNFVTQLQVTRLSGIGIRRHPSSSDNPPDPHLPPHHLTRSPSPRLLPSLLPRSPLRHSATPITTAAVVAAPLSFAIVAFVAEPPPPSPCHVVG